MKNQIKKRRRNDIIPMELRKKMALWDLIIS